MGGTGLEPVTPSLSSPQSCYSALAGTPSFWPVCRTVRTLPGAAFALVLGLRSPLLLAPVSTAAAATLGERHSEVRRGGGIWTDINEHVPLQPDPGLLTTIRPLRAPLERVHHHHDQGRLRRIASACRQSDRAAIASAGNALFTGPRAALGGRIEPSRRGTPGWVSTRLQPQEHERSAPIACSLTQADLANRQDRWLHLWRRAAVNAVTTSNGLRIRFRAAPGVEATRSCDRRRDHRRAGGAAGTRGVSGGCLPAGTHCCSRAIQESGSPHFGTRGFASDVSAAPAF
jgi:hypothetical protein